MTTEYAHLIEHLRTGNLVAFIGAGASREYLDPGSGRMWPGLPSGTDVVAQLSQKRAYIPATAPMPQACFLYKSHEGRTDLEVFLTERFDRPGLRPLPAHVVLADLPFATYVTTNWDTLLERALQEAHRKYLAIIDDTDVPRLRPAQVPVLKLHGCVSRPATMVASSDEYVALDAKWPIVDALSRTLLAQRVVLFVGFALSDPDFQMAFDAVRRELGQHMPRSVAVVASASEYERAFWTSAGVTVVEQDLTDFLRGLLRATAGDTFPAVYLPSEDWITNAYFQELLRIRTRPSETLVIDAFLNHLQVELSSPALSLDEVLTRATLAVSSVLKARPNLAAMDRLSHDLLAQLRTAGASKDAAEAMLQDIAHERQETSRRVKAKGRSLISKNDHILLYSQSQRVSQLLSGAPTGVQESCHLFVAECRPKSPHPFQDSLAVCETLLGSRYRVTIVPDAAIGNLMCRRQVNKVILGAHAVYIKDGRPVAFVNTCGSEAVVSVACQHGIPVYVVAEDLKLVEITSAILPEPAFSQEEEVFADVQATLVGFRAQGLSVDTVNVGYDRCRWPDNVTLITAD